MNLIVSHNLRLQTRDKMLRTQYGSQIESGVYTVQIEPHTINFQMNVKTNKNQNKKFFPKFRT